MGAQSIAPAACHRTSAHRAAGRSGPARQGKCDCDEGHPEKGVALAETVSDVGYDRFETRCTPAWPHADDHGQFDSACGESDDAAETAARHPLEHAQHGQAAGISEASVRRI
jgi:transposase